MQTLTLNFEYRSESVNRNGLAPIYLRATYAKRHRRTSTGYKIEPKYWDAEKQRVKRNYSNSIRINAELNEIRERAQSYYETVQDFNLDDLIDFLNGKKKNEDLLLPFFEQVYEGKRLRLKDSTTKQHAIMMDYIRDYDEKITFADIDYKFRQKFESWIRRQDKRLGKGLLHTNYIASIIKTLRRYLNESVKAGKIAANPFTGERISTVDTRKVYLTSQELSRIEALDVSHRRGYIPESLRMFLFCCYTGLAFIDAITLTKDHITEDGEGLRLIKTRQKTKRKQIAVNLPLYLLFEGRPERLAREQMNNGNPYNELFGPFEKHYTKTYNDHLKEFARLAGIDKNISSHTARHTCAMILLNDYRRDFTTVAGVLGHASTATTQKHYAKLLPHGLDDRLRG